MAKKKERRIFAPCTGAKSTKCPSALSVPYLGLHCACVGEGKPCCYCGFKFKEEKP